jgi:hypothetical protein
VIFAAITLCVAFQRVISKVRIYFVIDSVRRLLDTASYNNSGLYVCEFFIQDIALNLHNE